MKRIFMFLLAVIVFCVSLSLAEDLSSRSDSELTELYRRVTEEMERRHLELPDPGRPETFRDAVESAGEDISVGGDMDYLAVVTERDGTYVRAVTLLDDRARELYMAAMDAEDASAAFDAFDAYAWSLPVSYTEEITQQPKKQSELDVLSGKTVGELLEAGFFLYSHGGGIGMPTTVDLSYGLFNYAFEADASFEEYQVLEEKEALETLKVKNGKPAGFSVFASNPAYLADGTYAPEVVPHITAEEAAAAAVIPPAEEYTARAWPLDAEGYADLQRNIDTRFGQVYMVKGTVHQVLSQSPARVIIRTGEDGESQPVVIECPEGLSFTPEAGSSLRIYADVSSSCYILPVLTARYIYSDAGDGTAAR